MTGRRFSFLTRCCELVCGIFAALMDSPIDEVLVRKAVRALGHRGPDGEGVWISGDRRTALGHRRLSVIAPDDGYQPVACETGRIRAVVNGEFYGFEQLQRELADSGHRFATQSDSEVAVHLYEALGLEFVGRLRGEFALVVRDELNRRLVAVRDRFGVKPLLYATTASGTLIASEAKALFAAGVPRDWDVESFHHAAALQYVLPDRTLFRGIRQVPPGHLLVVPDAAPPRIERYWEPPPSAAETQLSPAAMADLVAACRTEIVDAVQVRMRADARVCVQLSGGLDSSAVLGIAAAHSERPIQAYTIVFDSAGYDERTFAAAAAAHAGAALQPVNVRPTDILRALGDAVHKSEGLCINGHLAAKHLLSKRMRDDGFKVVLTGEGADEAFAGYGHLRIDHWRELGRQDLIDGVTATNRSSLGMMLPIGESLDLTGVRQRLGYVPVWMEAKAAFGRRVHSLLHDDFLHQHRGHDPLGEFVDAAWDVSKRNLSRVDCSSLLWTQSALPNYILSTLGDGTEMAHSMEGRVPFLDHQLWEFLGRVPVGMKIRESTEKYILREAVRGCVPDSIRRREKHPFDAPPVTLADGPEVREFISDTVCSRSFHTQPFFDAERLRKRIVMLGDADDTTRLAWDPVIMTALSTALLQERLMAATD